MSEVPPVHVLFWFDVEDYLTPESDDALLGLLDCFERQGVQGTWKVVAEKARVLEERGREDVIRALQRQDIGYHTDTHSQHPVLAEYLRSAGWEDGVEEIIRRERPGYEDTVRILGPSSTFGQAGGSWAPQIYPFMRDAGIPLFMDEASHIGLDGVPFWYCNVPHINRLETRVTRMDFEAGEEGLRQGIGRFDEIHRDVVDDGGGLISIYYHPCEFATLAFWDGSTSPAANNPLDHNGNRHRFAAPSRWQQDSNCSAATWGISSPNPVWKCSQAANSSTFCRTTPPTACSASPN
ncbi:MAG: hypothetical protein VYB08_16750 [Candidatus Latescibacterota bacterium]|nr:hypothetical protein [Candidatus Latescibacterota bacterium]